jgi:histone deacetylase complex regulatory component SIN3
LEQAQA